MESALVGIVGVVIGVLFSNLGTLVLDTRRRRERIRDVQTALRAEMRTHWHRLDPASLEARAALIVSRIEEGGDYTPFIPREDTTTVYDALTSEMHILPNAVIDPVVLYYAHARSIAHFVDDLRSDAFARLEPSRKVQMYRDYIAMKVQAYELVGAAISAIDDARAKNQLQ